MAGTRARLFALSSLALSLLASCSHRPPVVLGQRMPAGCTKAGTTSERCAGWILDRLFMTVAFTPYRDAAIDAYVASVGRRLVAASGDRRAWTFRVLDSTEVQAFSGMGTHVYINRGALALLRDESELAGVLGHEIGHVLGGHTHETFEELAKDLAASTLTQAEQVQSARDDEIQADETAVTLLARAGYDLSGVERMMRAYAATVPEDGQDRDDVHPPWVERMARVQAAIASLPTGGAREAAAFRAHMAGLVVGPDPREAALVGGAAVFARAGVAVSLPGPAKDTDVGITLELGENDAVALRVVDRELAKYLPSKPDADGILMLVAYRGPIALAFTAKGPRGRALADTLRSQLRAPTPAELAHIKPQVVDLDAPRLLWLPPKA